MKVYTVTNSSENYCEDFYSLSEAKKAMKEHNAKGYIYKIYSNGDFENCGEIKIKGSNKTFVANTRQRVKSY